jgi:hypothetical protein
MWDDFRQVCGYDLRAELHRLYGDIRCDRDGQVRGDYRRWILDRFLKAFVQPYRAFCDQNRLCLVGHFSPEDDPIQETACLGSAMAVMKRMTCPGTDLIVPFTGTATAPTLNLGSLRVGSVRAQTGAPCAMSESLGLSGWSVTSAQARQILTWQKVLGVDRFFLHGFYTSNEGVQNYEALPDFGPYSSIFHGMGAVNEWLKRLETRMDADRCAPGVAVFNSLTTYWQWGPAMNTARLEQCRDSLWQTLLGCLQAHVAVHLVDEADVADAVVEEGRLRIGAGRYETLLIPDGDGMGAPAWGVLSRALEHGVALHVFGRQPWRAVNADGSLAAPADPPGRREGLPFADRHWARRHLVPAARIDGAGSHLCYVRRFEDKTGSAHLLAVNVSDQPLELLVKGGGGTGLRWAPVEVDGDFTAVGLDGLWHLPARGCGWFAAAEPAPAPARPAIRERRPLALAGRRFRRESANVCRLSAARVLRRGRGVASIDFPRPYWQLFDDFKMSAGYQSYLGLLPLESTVPEPDLGYRFVFDADRDLARPVTLILDPRCARGRLAVWLNGQVEWAGGEFPLPGIVSRRLRLRGVKRGRNQLDVRFQIGNAMEGLLSQLYLEGDFEVDVKRAVPRLLKAEQRPDPTGWTAAGLPHYMGTGFYRWTERIAADERGAWRALELEQVCDSAELWVNGTPCGTRAWAPWRWPLPELKPGPNRFELRVWSTAGNKHELDWPDQPQGWIGGGWLVGGG